MLRGGIEGARRGQKGGKERFTYPYPLLAIILVSFNGFFTVNEWC